jgi:hypothetical protein
MPKDGLIQFKQIKHHEFEQNDIDDRTLERDYRLFRDMKVKTYKIG